jgi:hypothetical protein
LEEIAIPYVDWLRDWDRVKLQADAQTSYVQDEIKRIAEEGEPVIFAVLNLPLLSQQEVALRVLNQDSPVNDFVNIRLRPGAVPPKLDPQGRQIPASKAGHLCAKVGNLGGRIAPNVGGANVERYSGRGTQSLSHANRDTMRYVWLAPGESKTVSVYDAILILRKWGVGCVEQRYTHRKRPDAQDHWLVYEECKRWGEVFDPPKPPKKAAA